MNQALLGKWLLRIGERKIAFGIKLPWPNMQCQGKDTLDPTYRLSALWKGIVSVRETFSDNINFRVSLGRKF